MIHETTKKFLEGFHYDAHPMGMLVSTVAALSTVYPDAQEHSRSGDPRAADHPADRQDADDRGVCLSSQPRAIPTSIPTTT